jgi:transcription elongation factor GreA
MAASPSQVNDRRHWPSEREEPTVTVPVNADETLPITAGGYERRCRELDALRNDARRGLVERLREARHQGDLEDNPELQAVLEEQSQLERRIALLESRLALAVVVAPIADGRAGIGSIVRVRDDEGAMFEYELVGPLESDAGNGRVSIGAPVGQALLGQRSGARVEVATPGGPLTLELVSIQSRRETAAKAA